MLNPERILQTGLAFWASKTLLSAIELGVFTELASGPQSFEALQRAARAAPARRRAIFSTRWSRSASLRASGDRYANTPETDLFLDRKKPSYVGGILEMANKRLYPFWGNLTEALRTGSRRTRSRPAGPDSSRRCMPIRRG